MIDLQREITKFHSLVNINSLMYYIDITYLPYIILDNLSMLPWINTGLACVGWIFCCPLMICGICLRESPTDDSDLHDDPCLPCYYDNNN